MKNLFILLLGSILTICLISCEKNNKQDLVDTTGCDTSLVSFTNDLVAEIDAKCNTAGCHNATSQAGGYNLVGYANIKSAINGGRFQGAINQEPVFSPMPKNSDKLDACYLEKLNAWISSGAPNN